MSRHKIGHIEESEQIVDDKNAQGFAALCNAHRSAETDHFSAQLWAEALELKAENRRALFACVKRRAYKERNDISERGSQADLQHSAVQNKDYKCVRDNINYCRKY